MGYTRPLPCIRVLRSTYNPMERRRMGVNCRTPTRRQAPQSIKAPPGCVLSSSTPHRSSAASLNEFAGNPSTDCPPPKILRTRESDRMPM